MKYFLIILIIFWNVCYGQLPISAIRVDSGWIGKDSMLHSMIIYKNTTIQFYRKQDTVKCFVLYSDTSLLFYTTKNYHVIVEDTTRQGFGRYDYKQDTTYYKTYQSYPSYFYSIRELHNTGEYSTDPGSCSGCYHDYYQHIQYLDKNKQKLSPNIVVWQAIEIK